MAAPASFFSMTTFACFADRSIADATYRKTGPSFLESQTHRSIIENTMTVPLFPSERIVWTASASAC